MRTLPFFFLSDNGPQGDDFEAVPELAEWANTCCDNSHENIGRADSYTALSTEWAAASSTPYRLFKGYTSEGGIKVPAIFHYDGLPADDMGNTNMSSIATVKDVLPTILDLAGIKHPGGSLFDGRLVLELQGTSLIPLISNEQTNLAQTTAFAGWELFGHRAIRHDDWKIVYVPSYDTPNVGRLPHVVPDRWQLYNLVNDAGETEDLSGQFPEKLNELIGYWEQYKTQNGVVEITLQKH